MKILAASRGLVILLVLFIGGQTLAAEYKIKVGSPLSISKMLSGEIGEKIDITLAFQQLDAIGSHGLAIILPSSTANMEDELFYAEKMRNIGFTTVVVNGAAPRYEKKFTRSYTSAMIVYDLAKALEFVNKRFGPPKKVLLLASSTGSLAILASQLEPVISHLPSLKSVTHAFMLNAACPANVAPKLSRNAKIFAVNGLQDDSTPASGCAEMKLKNHMPNVHLLTYEGAHHFESQVHEDIRQVDGWHMLPTCTINYDEDTKLYVKKRDGSASASEKDQGFVDMQKWVYENCLKRGHVQGYNKESAAKFWNDVKRLTK